MIDVENEVFTRIANAIREKYPDADITGIYGAQPAGFPHVSICQTDSYEEKTFASSSTTENVVRVTFEVNIYSNKASGKKQECKELLRIINDAFYEMNFIRLVSVPVLDPDDLSIYRHVAQFRARTDGKYFYR